MREQVREERRQVIAAATLQLAAQDGVGAVSLRAVAHRAGVSMGQVQHHFGTIAEVILHAVRLGLAQLDTLLDAATAASVGPDRLKDRARALLDPGADASTALRALAHLRGIGVRDQRVATAFADFDQRQREHIEATLASARSRRVLHTMVDPHLEADLFWTLMLTVAVEVASGLRTRDDGLALLRYHFRSLARNRLIASSRGRGRARSPDN